MLLATVVITITAGSLVDALNQLGEQAGLQMLYYYAELKPYRVRAVHCDCDPAQIVSFLVRDTPYSWSRLPNGTISIVPREQCSIVECDPPWGLTPEDTRPMYPRRTSHKPDGV